MPYFALGSSRRKGFATSLALLPLAIVANLFGFWVVRVTPHRSFLHASRSIIMLLISLELTRSGMTDVLRG